VFNVGERDVDVGLKTMRRILGQRAKSILRATGHYRRKLVADRFPGVAVLCYHGVRRSRHENMVFRDLHVTVDELATHCRFVRENCHPIALDTWIAAERGGPSLPARPVLMTFDDGYRSVFTIAKEVLEQYQIPAVVFVSSEPVPNRQMFWHDAVARLEGANSVEDWKGRPYREWRARCEAIGPARDCCDESVYAPLRIEEITALGEHQLFAIGGHTGTHAILSRATLDEQREEIASNRATLEEWTGREVRAFAYPNGQPSRDYTAESVRLLRETGYEMAFTTKQGFAIASEPCLERSRLLMLAGINAAELGHRLVYSWRRLLPATISPSETTVAN